VEPSDSPWSANIRLVSEKNTSEKRVCIDYRKLNAVTKLATYPMATFDSIVDSIASQSKSSWFASLDPKSGYFQSKMAPEDAYKTAFQVAGLGSVAFLCLPQCCAGSANFFQRVEVALRNLPPEVAVAYLDDVICYAPPPDFTQKIGAHFGSIQT
jgi:hypothetical protein